jgi:hypothetical protein
MSSRAVEYVRAQLINHARLFFADSVASLLQSEIVRFLPYSEAVALRGNQVVIPTDVPVPSIPESPWRFPFNDTELTLWNPLPRPDGDDWRAVPNDATPAWYRHASGTLMAGWNLFGNVFDLLTFGEEQRILDRDHHGRFRWRSSPRLEKGLLEVPAVNEAVALLADAVVNMARDSEPAFMLDCLSGSSVVVLSHDCDLLTGNGFWTQAARLHRFLHPMTKLRLPRASNLWWCALNTVRPHRYYFDDITGMIDIEQCFGYKSTLYLLNGSGGRFGARSPFSEIERLLKRVPPSWDMGIHYNYDTHLAPDRFAAQLEQLQNVVSRKIVSGRAHYLKFDPFRSFSFWRDFGIYADESSGWPDYVGYRNGIAGCFQTYDPAKQATLDICELPLVVLEDALIRQHGPNAVSAIEKHLQHLSRIGGALTILIHPGQFQNPEFRPTLGLFHELLKVFRRIGAVSYTARQLADQLR